MLSNLRVCCLRLTLLVAGLSACGPAAWAQDDEPKGVEYPIQLIQVAGIERLQQKADAMFLAAERPELSDFVAAWMQNTLQDLKGWDRTKPAGMMFYIKPGLVPGIATISFLPTSDVNELLRTLAGPDGQVREVGGKAGRYEILGITWGPDELAARQIGDYLFITENSDAIELDRTFPSVDRLISRLSARYDASYSLLLKNLPPATKTLFIEFFKNSAMAGLQQRDDEPDAAYRIRRANGESMIDFLDKIVNQGEELTVGAFVDAEKQSGSVELEISGTRDSGLAKFFQDQAGRRSYFTPVVDEAAALTMNMSWQLDKKQRKVFTELFTLAPEMIDEENRKSGGAGGALTAFQPLFRTLLATAEDGHFDMFAQLSGSEPMDYRIIGGFRVLGGSGFPAAVTQALQFVKNFKPPGGTPGGIGKVLDDAKLDAESIGGHPLHVFPLPGPPDRMGKTMFGETANLYIYASPQALWLAYGNDSARDQLAEYVDRVSSPPTGNAPTQAPAPFLLVTHGHQWVNARLASGENPEKERDLADSSAAFSPENDELRVTSRPTDNGARTRIELQSGFISWIGRTVAGQIDRAVERQANPEKADKADGQGRRNRNGQGPRQ
ncbi:MAG: hypothetical protein SH850_20380 [Planctomycetaceae bacterium]|nr:hypothetical protein [Planctomycetaceae bacterium]